MECIKVGAAALNQTPLDWDHNYSNIMKAIEMAKEQKVEVLCLPEMCITGYGCEDRFFSHDVQQQALEVLARVARQNWGMVVCVGLPIMFRNAIYNTIAVLKAGEILGFVAKQHLAGDGIHYEPRWFKEWPAGQRGMVTFSADMMGRFPEEFTALIGDLQFDFRGLRIGFEICEDAWVAERPGSRMCSKGVDIILNPSASHFAFGKHEIRERFVTEGSRAFGVTYVYANLLGNEAGRAIYDGDCLIATGGSLVAQGPRFSAKDVELTTAVVDIHATRTKQASTASYQPSCEHDSDSWVKARAGHTTSDEMPTRPIPLGTGSLTKFEEFEEAVSLGLLDYMRKSRSKGFVISLSGGADSAACAVLVRFMIEKGITRDEDGWVSLMDIEIETERFLTCVYQGTSNSSETTWNAAKEVAGDIGARFVTLEIDPVVEQYKSLISKGFGLDLTWEKHDLALQNIQARARAPGVWMIANLEHKLLITTSNRSEAAVGYCTMDGDTAGGLAPIAGIDKAFLRDWIRSCIPRFPSLKLIDNQQPTAELRPGSSQTDEEDLMPYPLLDYIENLAIQERKGPAEVMRCLQSLHNKDESHEVTRRLYGYVEKFFLLWARNQWKREKLPASFHVDDRNLDPKTWCRFPILSGGFRVELAKLRERLQIL